MLCAHINMAFISNNHWLSYIGRFSFPIFAFLISEGYVYTKNLKKYFLRLFIAAYLAQLPFTFVIRSDKYEFNTICTLIIGLLTITIYDKTNKYIGIIAAIVLSLIAGYINVDYGIYGVAVIFFFYVFRENKSLKTTFFVLSTIIYFSFRILKYYPRGTYMLTHAFEHFLPFCIFTALAIIPILFYNNKQGPKTKYFFYIFYPLHLTILALIKHWFI